MSGNRWGGIPIHSNKIRILPADKISVQQAFSVPSAMTTLVNRFACMVDSFVAVPLFLFHQPLPEDLRFLV